MRRRKTYCFILLMICVQFQLLAQKAKYAEITSGYDIKVPQNTGNTMHIWSASAEQSPVGPVDLTLTLHVFSTDMHLITEKKVSLGKVKFWDMDFRYSDNCYYAHIFYISEAHSRMILKVDQTGNITDTSETYGPWMRTDSSERSTEQLNASGQLNSTRQLNKVYAIVNSGKNLFAIKAENYDTSAGAPASNISFLSDEVITPRKPIQKIVIKKINLKSRKEVEQVYASSLVSFYYPFINVTDTGIFACAFAEPELSGRDQDTHKNSFFFVTRLDTNLNQSGTGPALLKIAKTPGNQIYSPNYLFSIDHNFFIISIGRNTDETYSGMLTNTWVPPAGSRFINSARMMMIDNKNNLLKDTAVDGKASKTNLNWNNRFVTISGSSMDFFVGSKYRGSKNGITHLNIDRDGNIKEEDMIVNVRYDYLLSRAKKSGDGVLFVPYTKNGKITGVMKLEYEQEGSFH